jgi:hypothetical protein
VWKTGLGTGEGEVCPVGNEELKIKNEWKIGNRK